MALPRHMAAKKRKRGRRETLPRRPRVRALVASLTATQTNGQRMNAERRAVSALLGAHRHDKRRGWLRGVSSRPCCKAGAAACTNATANCGGRRASDAEVAMRR
ncbi:hypothetical protein BU23DRAFT_53399 [Bimuria novae-zelandiae CBS 107.79]|uniref:Uncharacterized protein n=1 Tax=Bimuria novae-zelandiae CBS 107.79 TaxID=1447943 RepID=A0A6A5UHK6_9PLEO|nr:hypothetical protein BU23DRAFT_53399 [Bimuria novae-zelandiae CBS 107.79]